MCVPWSRPSSRGDRQQIWTNIIYFRKVVCSFTIANVILNHSETHNSQSSYSPHSMTANTLDFGCVLALKNVNTLERNPSTTPLLDLCESACWHVHCTQSYMCMFSSLRQSQVTYTSRHVASASSQLKDAPPPPPVGGPELTYLPHATHHMSQPSPPPLLRPSTPPPPLHLLPCQVLRPWRWVMSVLNVTRHNSGRPRDTCEDWRCCRCRDIVCHSHES